ncbi:FAD-dependent monooxygenase [Couchioplanes caeruleus]|uniref:2-polyprenyl-6-methoxyphenol hydroxylase-like FAD-dependent oxidoreductase n=1 Tax=Couchioplanes caeruleus TaxID=56438 RepID=A0A3N1GM68_9ACTN|nr:FAD-dependent monooxygenase [Couchioplanes caeruleus]ROP31357.1 2-polyprenyl-6-methoxyphenol hydroxylase-like FAD-dependent oxidoreductase [Couchioplanes caeruleus]
MDLRRVVVIGGGPAGLFLARLIKLRQPDASVELYEHDGPDEAFGFGVVLSDHTLAGLRAADAATYQEIMAACVGWKDVRVAIGDHDFLFRNYPFTAISRHRLLRLLQNQAKAVGVRMTFGRRVTVTEFLDSPDAPDVIAVAEGVHSGSRTGLSARFGTNVEPSSGRYIWFGTRAPFGEMTFPFVATEHGGFAAHAYPYGDGMSTFIVEADVDSCLGAGMDVTRAGAPAPGETDETSRRILTEIFASHLQEHQLIGNNSRWGTFRVVRNERWSTGNVVLLGDAAHTAHFSVGSGTKLAMEDAITLAEALTTHESLDGALTAYAERRRPAVAVLQSWAQTSMRWWESFPRCLHMPPDQFALHFMTRIGAISYAGLRSRHADRMDDLEAAFVRREAIAGTPSSVPPTGVVDLAGKLGELTLVNRRVAVVSQSAGSGMAPLPEAYGLILFDASHLEPGDLEQLGDRVRASPSRFGLSLTIGDIARFTDLPTCRPDVVEVVVDRVDGCAAIKDLAAAVPAVLVGVDCPDADPWSDAGTALLDRCVELRDAGAAAVHLRHRDGGIDWPRMTAFADRVRTETRTPVLIDVPPTVDRQDRARTVHLGILSGRYDLAAWRLHL